MITGNRGKSFSRWGLKNNPFSSLPPDKSDERTWVFTGRNNEVETLMNLAERPCGVFLSGMFGIGKSILVLETLRKLTDQGYVTAYANYNRDNGFYVSVLEELALTSAKYNMRGVYDILTIGISTSDRDIPSMENIKGAAYRTKNIFNAIKDIKNLLNLRLPLVIVVDELEHNTDIGDIPDIIYYARQLIGIGYVVILLGHPSGKTAACGSCTHILNPLPLGPLSDDELIEMMEKYLGLSRIKWEDDKTPTYPFTQGAARLIAESITKAGLTPRHFNFGCRLLLESAANASAELIDEEFIIKNWGKIAEDFLIKILEEEDIKYLEIISKYGEFSEDTREVIQEIGGQFAEYTEVRTILAKLVWENILIERDRQRKHVIETNPMFNKDFFEFVR